MTYPTSIFSRTSISAVFFAGLILFLARPGFAYGPNGHQMVGAIADERLAHTPAGEKVSNLLDGITLEKASVIPDEIKGWDKKGPDDPNIFHYSAHPKIDEQLVAFWKANQPTKDQNSPMPSHHWFHYTDVPLMPVQKYADGKAGRSKWDIVHMSAYCIDVLQGKTPEDNERKITKPIAIILLAHYLGDIHQPLHVGAEFFDQHGNVVDPDKEPNALPDEGGNSLNIKLAGDRPGGRLSHAKNLHGFWDQDTVGALLPPVPETATKDERLTATEPARKALATEMAKTEPKNWKLPDDVPLNKYPEAWADDILSMAREAHTRLTFKDVKPQQHDQVVVAVGDAVESNAADHVGYLDWSSKVVREELHKAGWRLADVLEKAVSPGKEKTSNP